MDLDVVVTLTLNPTTTKKNIILVLELFYYMQNILKYDVINQQKLTQ